MYMLKNRKLFPIILELVGIAGIGCGIGTEYSMGSDVGYLAITIGSVLIAIGGVIWGKFIRKGSETR
jgi:hypothetical protein